MALQFLTENDFKPLISDAVLEQVMRSNTPTLERAEMMAISEMSSFLNTRFKTEEIFSAVGNERNPVIIMYLIDMVLYHLYTSVSPRAINELRVNRYDNAMAWLNKITKGELQPNLPLKVDPNGQPDNRLKWGSNPKLNLQYD
jgi:phage gp36-like protein